MSLRPKPRSRLYGSLVFTLLVASVSIGTASATNADWSMQRFPERSQYCWFPPRDCTNPNNVVAPDLQACAADATTPSSAIHTYEQPRPGGTINYSTAQVEVRKSSTCGTIWARVRNAYMQNDCTEYSFDTCDQWDIWSNRASGATTLDGGWHSNSSNIWDDQVQVANTNTLKGRAGARWTTGNGGELGGARTAWVEM